MARSFVEPEVKLSVLVLPVDYLFKVNHKRDTLTGYDNMSEAVMDSILMEESDFLKYISDSVFLERYINSFIKRLEEFGVQVYTEEFTDEFLFIQELAYTVNIAQLEIEEYYLEKEESQEISGLVYYKTMYLDAVTINSWFEVTQMNPVRQGREVLFASYELSDYLDGYFSENIFTGKVTYKYLLRELETEDIHEYAGHLGALYADYTFDYILNEYITDNYPPGKKRRFYMHYNPKSRSFELDEPGFIILEAGD